MRRPALRPYVPDLAAEWLRDTPAAAHRAVKGSMVLADISGFTPLTERLTRLGVVGSEELSDILDSTFTALLAQARPEGADLLKWGGDAVLLLFRGPDHAARAVRAALGMRRTLRSVGRTRSSAGEVRLRMSVGVHSGRFDLFLVGDPAEHRELVVCGPASSRVAELESTAGAGQVAVSPRTASLLPPSTVRATGGEHLLVSRTPQGRPSPDVVPDDAATDPVDVAVLLPPPLREHLLSGARDPEHRAVAVAFVEFSGADALHRDRGATAVADAVDALVRRAQEACRQHGVTFLESDISRDGGKLMLVCGAPTRGEDVEDRLVRAVRRVVDLDGPLRLRAGINRGRVFASDFGPAFRRTYSVKGDAVNLAARVMARAEPAQVLATRAVVELLDGGVAAETVAPFMVKGRSGPVDAAAVTVLRPAAAHHPGRPDDVFLGREPEVARVLDLLAEVRGGHGQVLEVRGAPGVGKSALVRAVAARCDDVAVLHGDSRRFGGTASHQAVRRLLRDLVGLDPGDPAEAQVRELRRVVEEAAPGVLPWFPLLAATIGVELPDTPQLQDLDDRYRPVQAGRALAELLSAVLTGPALLVLEGADDMDGSSATMLHEVLAVLDGRPWLVLLTRRTADRGLVPGDGDGHHVLDLRPLHPSTSLALVAAWSDHHLATGGGAQRHALGEHQLRALAARAGGNPLHLRSLIELAVARGTVDGLPVSVEEVIGAEVDALEPRARTVLRLASVLGEQLDLDHLAELAAAEGRTLRPGDLRRLSAQLVPEGPTDSWYRFSSTLLHETVYAGLPYRLRRRLHQRAGESLEAAAASTDPPPWATLSTHFFEAGRYDKALDYTRRAAERAVQAYASLEALHLYERALTCAARAPTAAPPLVGRLHEAAGDAAEMAGLSVTAISHYRSARSGLRSDPLATGGVIAKEVGLHQRVGAFDRSTRIAGHALRTLEGVTGREADALRSRLAVQTAFVHHLRARHSAAVRWSTRAVELALGSDDPAMLARAYNAHALVLAVAGLPADRPYGELALASSEESGDLRLQVKCLTNLAISAIIDGGWPRAGSLLARAAGVAERLGDAANVVNVTYNRCDVLVRQGRWAEAATLLAGVGREARAQDDQELVALVELELGKVAAGQGRPAAARTHLAEARDRLVALGLERETAEADVALLAGEVLTAAGGEGREAAEARVRAALADLAGPVAEENRARLHLLHGTLLLAAGRAAEAEEAFDAGVSAPAGEGGLDRALNGLGAAQAAAGQGRSRTEDRSRAEAVLARLGVREPPFPVPWWPLDRPAVVVQDVDDDEQVTAVAGGVHVVGAEVVPLTVVGDTLGDARLRD